MRRTLAFARWMTQEFVGRRTTVELYDDLARRGDYDLAIDFDERVRCFRRALRHVSHEYHSALDIASGTGAFVEALVSESTAGVTAIDISNRMLAVAARRFQSVANVKFRCADFLAVEFPDSSFDLITLGYASRFIPVGSESLFADRVSRWLRSDGTLLVVTNEFVLQSLLAIPLTFVGLPRGSNYAMDLPFYIEKAIRPYLRLQRSLVISNTAGLLRDIALYFRKAN
ncbi:MAG: class I SAM-dependent methyltransferase [Deltaproteobacteria bacterium]|nr:class I SAM-dependent methyltransferase [Deltaproteobacteria bacterium]